MNALKRLLWCVVACQPINGISAEAGTYTTQTVFIDIRFLGDVIDGTQVIVHAMAAVIGTDFFQPFHTKTRKSPTVRSDDDIAVRSHQL